MYGSRRPQDDGYRGSIAITIWKLLVPFPGALDNAIERLKLRLPAKLALDFLRGSDQPRRVAEPAWLFDGVDLSPGDFPASSNHFMYAGTASSPKIVKFALGRGQGQNVGPRKIDNVDIVANAGAVRGLIIGAVNFQVRFLTECDFKRVWNQMGLEPVIFAKISRCTGRIEITQGNK